MKQHQLFISDTHACAYLDGAKARTLFVDPQSELTVADYGELIDRGFRRSGAFLYRPGCERCRECLPTRLSVDRFQARRSQRRIWDKWRSAETIIRNPTFRDEHFALYNRYVNARHACGGMNDISEQRYLDFLTASWCDTLFVEFRFEGRLAAVAVTDRLPQGLSAVYTFFDPDYTKLSPGVFAILWQIAETRRLGLDWLYLGFLISGCQKMAYKSEYRPLQMFDYSRGQWLSLEERLPRDSTIGI